MKNYDLSQYVLREKDIIMFPLTQEETGILKSGKELFEDYIKMPYIAGMLCENVLNEIINAEDMENDYWFMNALWIVAHIPSREIFGSIRYKKEEDNNKIIKNITVLSDCQETYIQATELFAKFLSVNGYTNIVIENEKDVI